MIRRSNLKPDRSLHQRVPNISQTSTYLEAEAADNDEAMRRYEERLQRIATGSETGLQTGPPSATVENTKPSESTESRH